MHQPEIKSVNQLFKERTKMLAAVELYISLPLQEQLRRKIALEKKKLLNLVMSKDTEQTGVRQSDYILDRVFFQKKPLNITPFE